MIEAMRRAFRDRAEFSGDPGFFPVPDRHADQQGARAGAGALRSKPITRRPPGEGGGRRRAHESDDTTHFSVIDEAGNIVSNTYTLNSFYGSQVMAHGTGVLLNDIMSGFSNAAGGRNEIKPGKRPLSSMTPTIVLHADGSPWFALGSPGSATIPEYGVSGDREHHRFEDVAARRRGVSAHSSSVSARPRGRGAGGAGVRRSREAALVRRTRSIRSCARRATCTR